MEPSLQRRVQRYGWDRAADFYEQYWAVQLEPAQNLMLAMADLRPGEYLLDTACGTGLVSLRAAGLLGPQGRVLGTDISEKMIEMAKAMALEKKIDTISFERMDSEQLGLPDAGFDVALCALGLMYIPDPLQALREIYRVLKPGSRLAVAVWGQRAHCGWAEIFSIVDRRVSSEVCPMFFNLGNPGMLMMSLSASGFEDIKEERISTVIRYQNAEQACGAAFAGGPVALAYHRFSDQVKEEVHREYLDSIAAYRCPEGYAVPGEFVVALARKK